MPYLDSLVARGVISPDALDGLLQRVADPSSRDRSQPPALGPEMGPRGGARTYTGASGDKVVAPDYGAQARGGGKTTSVKAWRVQKLMASGMAPEDIAEEMGITPSAVEALGKMELKPLEGRPFEEGSERTIAAARKGGSTGSIWAQKPELTERLLDLKGQGKSPAEIADALGVSRNAVIGRLDRLRRTPPDTSAPVASDWEIAPDGSMVRTYGSR